MRAELANLAQGNPYVGVAKSASVTVPGAEEGDAESVSLTAPEAQLRRGGPPENLSPGDAGPDADRRSRKWSLAALGCVLLSGGTAAGSFALFKRSNRLAVESQQVRNAAQSTPVVELDTGFGTAPIRSGEIPVYVLNELGKLDFGVDGNDSTPIPCPNNFALESRASWLQYQKHLDAYFHNNIGSCPVSVPTWFQPRSGYTGTGSDLTYDEQLDHMQNGSACRTTIQQHNQGLVGSRSSASQPIGLLDLETGFQLTFGAYGVSSTVPFWMPSSDAMHDYGINFTAPPEGHVSAQARLQLTPEGELPCRNEFARLNRAIYVDYVNAPDFTDPLNLPPFDFEPARPPDLPFSNGYSGTWPNVQYDAKLTRVVTPDSETATCETRIQKNNREKEETARRTKEGNAKLADELTNLSSQSRSGGIAHAVLSLGAAIAAAAICRQKLCAGSSADVHPMEDAPSQSSERMKIHV